MKSSTGWSIIALIFALFGVCFIVQIEQRALPEVLSYINACFLGSVLSLIIANGMKVREHEKKYHEEKP